MLSERIILRNLDGSVIVRPLAKYPRDIWHLDEDTHMELNEAGVEAWNSGAPIEAPLHGLVFCRKPLVLGLSAVKEQG